MVAPVGALLVLWVIGAWLLTRFQNRRLQRQIDEVDALKAE
jgi:hypothetical protein